MALIHEEVATLEECQSMILDVVKCQLGEAWGPKPCQDGDVHRRDRDPMSWVVGNVCNQLTSD